MAFRDIREYKEMKNPPIPIQLAFRILQRKFVFSPPPMPIGNFSLETIVSKKGFLPEIKGTHIKKSEDKVVLYCGGRTECVWSKLNWLKNVSGDSSLVVAPYPGYWPNKGKPSEKALYNHAERVFDELKKQYKEINVVAWSLGTGVASWLAANKEPNKVVLLAPYSRLVDVAQNWLPHWPVERWLWDKFDSLNNSLSAKSKALMVLPRMDQVVPVELQEKLFNSWFGVKELIVLEDGKHEDVFNDEIASKINFFISSED